MTTTRPAVPGGGLPDLHLADGDAVPADAAVVAAPGAGADELREAAGRLARGTTGTALDIDVRGLDAAGVTAVVEGALLGGYRFTRATGTVPRLRDVTLRGAADGAAVRRGEVRAGATAWARDLANTRSNEKTPAWLAGAAADRLARRGVQVVERDVEWLTEHGFGGVLAVGGGSVAPPRLIDARWRPSGAAGGPHVVLVGKGITFDSGGINRKVGTGMSTMYTDMSGGAAVLGALDAVAATELPVRVTALVPAAENAFGGGSFRPGDVVRHVGGRTSEIGNTDAEGRLVLADAIAYAAATLRPTAVVDIATLTGAMKVALGLRTGGLFASADALAEQLLAAGADAGEPLWRLPLPAEYEAALRSDIADATNAPGNPGAITAALFLRPFAAGLPWAHLDVAGPARAGEDDGMFARGGTAFGVRLLHSWIESLAR